MKPTLLELAIMAAVDDMAQLRAFPRDEAGKLGVMRLLGRMASTPDQVRWLAETITNRDNEWLGPRHLRGVFCTRFKPADGVEANPEPGSAIGTAIESAIQNHKALLPTELDGSLRQLGPVGVKLLNGKTL